MSGYSSLQNQLVKLSIDIEDKEKNCQLLKSKIAKEMETISNLESLVSQEYGDQMEKLNQNQAIRAKELEEKATWLINEKKELLADSEELVATVKEDERNTAAEVRGLHREAAKTMDHEKRLFRAGYEDRLQKYLAQKLLEYKESTAKGMQSEFNRLQNMHDSEMAEVDLWLRSEEKRLQESFRSRLAQQEDSERQAAKEELRLAIKALQDKANSEHDQLLRENARSLRTMQESLEREMDKQRALLSEKMKKLQRSNQSEALQAQESNRQRLEDLKANHQLQIEKIQNDHEKQIRQLRCTAKESLQRTIDVSNIRLTDGDSEEDEILVVASGRGATSSRLHDSPLKSDGSRSNRFSPQKKSTLRSDSVRDDNMVDKESSSARRREAEAQRDKQLHAEIRSLEMETLRLERGWKTRAEEEKSRVREAQAKEEAESGRRARRLNEDLSDLVENRERLFLSLQRLKQQDEAATKSVSDICREIQVYVDGIAAQRHRVQDKEALHKARLRELQMESGPLLRDLKDRCEDLAAQLKRNEREFDAQMRSEEEQHAAELGGMDRDVTTSVVRLDQQIASLKDVVRAESVKREALEGKIQRYRDGHALSLAGSSAPKQQRSIGGDSRAASNNSQSTAPQPSIKSSRSWRK